ncbi:hypothetical protein BGX27_009411 [Mortierella sp. AM989]|nr:hypothetical protein BGX27_009411 [Mortierella sp. AM989]
MSTSIEDNELPKAILTRIMKQVVRILIHGITCIATCVRLHLCLFRNINRLPENTNIQANAKLAMTKSTTLFINYLASAANDVAASAGHKIISGAHVLKAIESLDLEEMLPRLTEEFQAFQAIQKSRKEGAAKLSKDKDDSSGTSKKRKPTAEGSNSTVKARKSSSTANPRDGQDVSVNEIDDEEVEEEEENEDLVGKDDDDVGDEDDDENEEDVDEDEGNAKDNGEASLNMNEGDKDEEEKAPNLDEDDDSDGF